MSDGRRVQAVPRVFSFARSPRLVVSREAGTLTLSGSLMARLPHPVALNEMVFYIGERIYEVAFEAKYAESERRCRHKAGIRVTLPVDAMHELSIHNLVEVAVPAADPKSEPELYSIMYSRFLPKYLAARTRYYRDEENDLVAFFRQTAGKSTTFTVRHANVTDATGYQVKLALAWVLSKLAFWVNPILMYEKNSCHYEESARIVYERLLDEGRTDVRYVLNDKALPQVGRTGAYRRYIVRQHSFMHYLCFFRCRVFLGTESLAHALELRCQNLLVQRKIKSRRNTYVFLQHGVMYMISLDSPQRTSFLKSSMRGTSYVVVSSKKEARHFTSLAGFDDGDMIVCGLPKFDASYLNEGADKILVMPTWRIWEFNEIRSNPESSKYVRMIERMVSSIPAELKDKVVVAYHPLLETSTFLSSHMQPVPNYDELLRDTALIITDYSSISYDSFYRGSNVIFYWEERDECMEHYGGGTHLMITEEEAFGPVCYEPSQLADAVSSIYGKPQDEEYVSRYRSIVEHHDGKNTERLIGALVEKGVIR